MTLTGVGSASVLREFCLRKSWKPMKCLQSELALLRTGQLAKVCPGSLQVVAHG